MTAAEALRNARATVECAHAPGGTPCLPGCAAEDWPTLDTFPFYRHSMWRELASLQLDGQDIDELTEAGG